MDKPLSQDIAEQVVEALPMEDTDPRCLPGLHLSFLWGFLRVDFNMPTEPAAIIQVGGMS